MTNTFYVIKINDSYVRDVNTDYSDTQTSVRMSKTIEGAKLMNDHMRKNWITSMFLTLEMGDDNVTTVKVEVEADIDESSDMYGIRLKQGDDVTYLSEIGAKGLHTINNERANESEMLCLCGLWEKEQAEKMATLLKAMNAVDMLQSKVTDVELVPIKRKFVSETEI